MGTRTSRIPVPNRKLGSESSDGDTGPGDVMISASWENHNTGVEGNSSIPFLRRSITRQPSAQAEPSPPQENDCEFLVRVFRDLIKKHERDWTNKGLIEEITTELISSFNPHSGDPALIANYNSRRSSGFKPEFADEGPSASFNQVRHFAGAFVNAYYGGLAAYTAAMAVNPLTLPLAEQAAKEVAVSQANKRETDNSVGDMALNGVATPIGVGFAFGSVKAKNLPNLIESNVCR